MAAKDFKVSGANLLKQYYDKSIEGDGLSVETLKFSFSMPNWTKQKNLKQSR